MSSSLGFQIMRQRRPSGVVELLYRLRPDVSSSRVSSTGTRAVVDLPLPAGDWQTVTVDVVSDLHRVWPDLDPRDRRPQDPIGKHPPVHRNPEHAEHPQPAEHPHGRSRPHRHHDSHHSPSAGRRAG